MSCSSLGGHAITALSQGLACVSIWMDTGEDGLSEYHLKSNYDIIYQVGPGLFGMEDKDGGFSGETFLNMANYREIKTFEIKLVQGVKTRGGYMKGNKATEEIAKIRHIRPYKTISSPSRFGFVNNPRELLEFVAKLQKLGQKPVSSEVVVSRADEAKALVQEVISLDIYSNFITVGDGEDRTDVIFQEL